MTPSGGPAPPADGRYPGPPTAVYARMTAVLRAGLGVAIVLMGAALAVIVGRSPGEASGALTGANPVSRLLGLAAFGRGLASGDAEAYLELGVLALVATPILRVATGTYYYLRLGERRLGALTAVVLGLLLFGVLVLGPLVR